MRGGGCAWGCLAKWDLRTSNAASGNGWQGLRRPVRFSRPAFWTRHGRPSEVARTSLTCFVSPCVARVVPAACAVQLAPPPPVQELLLHLQDPRPWVVLGGGWGARRAPVHGGTVLGRRPERRASWHGDPCVRHSAGESTALVMPRRQPNDASTLHNPDSVHKK